MSRRKRREQEDEEVEEKVKEVVAKWSIKRIVIAIVIVFLAISSIYYYFSLKSYSTNSEKVIEKKDKPQIEIPSKEKVNTIIEDAQKSLEHIDTNDIVKSQPQIEKIIKDLQELTSSSRSAKDIVCSAVCK